VSVDHSATAELGSTPTYRSRFTPSGGCITGVRPMGEAPLQDPTHLLSTAPGGEAISGAAPRSITNDGRRPPT